MAATCSRRWPASTPTRSRSPSAGLPRSLRRGVRTGRTGMGGPRARACIAAHIIRMFVLVGAAILTAFEILPESSGRHAMAGWRSGIRDVGEVAWHVAAPLVAASTSSSALSPAGARPVRLRQPYTTTMGYANVTVTQPAVPVADRWAIFLAARSSLGSPCGAASSSASRCSPLFAAVVLVFDRSQPLQRARPPLWFLSVYLLAAWWSPPRSPSRAGVRRHRTAIWSPPSTSPRVLARVRAGRLRAWEPGGGRPLVALLLAAACRPAVRRERQPLARHRRREPGSAWRRELQRLRGQTAIEYRPSSPPCQGRRASVWARHVGVQRGLEPLRTPMALMLLRTGRGLHRLDGGLVFESSATTPYTSEPGRALGRALGAVSASTTRRHQHPARSRTQQLGSSTTCLEPGDDRAAKLDPSCAGGDHRPVEVALRRPGDHHHLDVFEVSNSASSSPSPTTRRCSPT